MPLRFTCRGWVVPMALGVSIAGFGQGPTTATMVFSGTTLPAAVAADLAQRMTLSEHADDLDRMHLTASEVWQDQEQPTRSDFESDQVFFYHSVHIEVMQSENGKPLGQKAQAKQISSSQNVEKRVDAVWQGAAAGRMVNIDGEVWTLDQIADHFAWTATPARTVQGRSTVTLHFEPLPGLHPHTRIERVLDSTVGDVTVDARTAQLLSGNFRSLGEVRYGGGLLAHIAFAGGFHMQPAGRSWVMHDVTVEVQGRELLKRLHGTQINTYVLQSVTPDAAARNR